jgi:hypothetical protein
MSATKQAVESLLGQLPDNCSFEDVQYHLYVLGKIRQGTQTADPQGVIPQAQAEERLSKWLIQ